jgi:N-formylglutamate amidohydrolase
LEFAPPQSVFEILAPAQWTTPIVFNSPHSGKVVPQSLLHLSKLSESALRQSEDCYVDELFDGCLVTGAPMLRALLSRAYIDLNREPYEFDARMFEEHLSGHFNTSSPRVACGLGTVPRVVADGLEIYRGRIPLAEAMSRVEHVYRPYHQALATLLNEAHKATGHVLLVDCHSMPNSSVQDLPYLRGRSVDVVLGDRFGASCSPEIIEVAHQYLSNAGLNVLRNRPYAGGFITENHGLPRLGRHAMQIELNRAIYMNEATQQKSRNFAALHKILQDLCASLAEIMAEAMPQQHAIAAE